MEFKDHFSGHAGDYARYRPDYPAALFEFLAQALPARECAWDAGTGNGQAALGLVPYFDRIIATDPSAEQIRRAPLHDKIEYFVASAESTDIPSHSVDLITVAQALHWFRFEPFFAEVRRVLKPEGLLAVWCYGACRVNPAVDRIVHHYYANIVGPFWPPERRYIDEQYRSVPFPMVELPAPDFTMKQEWNLEEFVGYLRTWSATRAYERRFGEDPLRIVHRALAKAWGAPAIPQVVRWPLSLRLGRVTAPIAVRRGAENRDA
jgi:SAM-dependent methyltransferase